MIIDDAKIINDQKEDDRIKKDLSQLSQIKARLAKSKSDPVEKDSKKIDSTKLESSKMITKPVQPPSKKDDAIKAADMTSSMQKMQKLRSILSENADLENKTPTAKDDNNVSPATRALLARDKKTPGEKNTPPPPPSKINPSKVKPDDKEKQARKSISLTSLIKEKDEKNQRKELDKAKIAELQNTKRASERKSLERRPSDLERRKSASPADSSPKRQSKLDRFMTSTAKPTGVLEPTRSDSTGSKLDDISQKLAKRKEESGNKDQLGNKKLRKDSITTTPPVPELESSRPIRSSRLKKAQEEKSLDKERDDIVPKTRRSDEKPKLRKEDNISPKKVS